MSRVRGVEKAVAIVAPASPSALRAARDRRDVTMVFKGVDGAPARALEWSPWRPSRGSLIGRGGARFINERVSAYQVTVFYVTRVRDDSGTGVPENPP